MTPIRQQSGTPNGAIVAPRMVHCLPNSLHVNGLQLDVELAYVLHGEF